MFIIFIGGVRGRGERFTSSPRRIVFHDVRAGSNPHPHTRVVMSLIPKIKRENIRRNQ
jgi:hypothetical protein